MGCPYKHLKNIFGKEGEGVHSYRFLNLAVVDVIFTIIAAVIVSYVFKIKFVTALIILFLLGIFMHRLFCVNTTINKLIFGKVN